MTDGQTQALEQVREIEAASHGSVALVTAPTETAQGRLRLDLSLDTSPLARAQGGLPLRARERFIVLVPTAFPFTSPGVWTRHRRFAGFAHVQWSRYLCLYLAPDIEWVPDDGMFGFIERLWKWLAQGALDQLDPVGGPLHPPATYATRNSVRVVARVDTPPLTAPAWTGLGLLQIDSDRRVDIIGWADSFPKDPVGTAAAVFLLSESMPWEFPQRMGDLLRLLSDRGISRDLLLRVLLGAAWQIKEGEPLYVLIGTPMRGIRGGELRQHLTAWRLDPTFASGVRLMAQKYSSDEGHRKIGEEVEDILMDWADKAEVSWCEVLEDRPEIVTRRDHTSPLQVVRGKTVAVWGCGALGGQVAIHLARAGAARIILRDNAVVTPGILIRQPYSDADIGRSKAEVLADLLRSIRASDSEFDAIPIVSNILTTALDDDWTDGASIVFDCTASRSVRIKLEKVRKDTPLLRADAVSMIISREATTGLVVLAGAGHTGGPADVYRRAKIDICRHASLRHVADAFYLPTAVEDLFQPEPGCSSPTFVGSSADAAALSAMLLNLAASDLVKDPGPQAGDAMPTAWGHVVIQPHALARRQLASADFAYLPDIVTTDSRRGYEVRTSVPAWKQMNRWAARSRDAVGLETETGGLSFGERNEAAGVIWVTEVGGPPPDSVARPDLFECGTVGTQQAHLVRERSSRGSVRYVGMWHTHPVSAPVPSATDLAGMAKILSDGTVNPSKSLLSILGTPLTRPLLGTFVFDREDVRESRGETYRNIRVASMDRMVAPSRSPNLGLALSGGGSRAIAFHLGCFRALRDRGILEEVGVLSAVSGGAVLAAMYAYSDDDFESFEGRVRSLLRRGLQVSLAKATFSPFHLARTSATSLVAGVSAKGSQVARRVLALGHDLIDRDNRSRQPSYLSRITPPFPRWASRTTALESVFRDLLFGDALVCHPLRAGLDIVLNATELRTGTAFRFGSRVSACSRFGSVQEQVTVATAVAASAAYPALLPALHKRYTFDNRGKTTTERVVLTDGGVYDNLGASCLDPTRDPDYTAHVYPCDQLICCRAGHGQWDGATIPYGWASRMARTVEATFRKAQDQTVRGLFLLRKTGSLSHLVLPYLGMRDESLERDPAVGALPSDFVRRERVIGYPTDFRAMSDEDFNRLSSRGEQLTNLLIDAYWPA
jgi:integrative and conjugative element protein (TIGR02256 family)